MGQTAVKSVQGIDVESLLTEKEPPEPKPPKKFSVSSGAKFTELKLKEHRAGAHSLGMVSCVH